MKKKYVNIYSAFMNEYVIYFREEKSAFIAFLGSVLSVILVLMFVPKYTKRTKAEGMYNCLWPHLHMTSAVGGVLNTNTHIYKI